MHRQRILRVTQLTDRLRTLEGCFDDGTILLRYSWQGSDPTFPLELRRVRLDGTVVNNFPTLTLRRSGLNLNFVSVSVWGQRVFVGEGATSEVRVYRSDGKLIQIIRSADVPQKITAEEIERAKRISRRSFDNIPTTNPTYLRFLVDSQGRLWLENWPSRAAEPVVWTTFDSTGRLIGKLVVPARDPNEVAEVVAFGNDEVQLKYRDKDGFAQLSFHPLVRRSQ